MVLVVNTLDECKRQKDIRAILQLLTEAEIIKPARLRVFVTSKPGSPIEPDLRRMFGIMLRDLVLYNVCEEIVDRDI
ncbi:hypothetical protein LTR28_011878 [Elasticomyces elasticus]|nr:hypothetical protein LTR28_011878 [Elasticomyces elasticus]